MTPGFEENVNSGLLGDPALKPVSERFAFRKHVAPPHLFDLSENDAGGFAVQVSRRQRSRQSENGGGGTEGEEKLNQKNVAEKPKLD